MQAELSPNSGPSISIALLFIYLLLFFKYKNGNFIYWAKLTKGPTTKLSEGPWLGQLFLLGLFDHICPSSSPDHTIPQAEEANQLGV